MEALACGTPVVSTDCIGGSSEVLEGGKWGRLVPVGDPDAMAAAILATLESIAHPDVRQRASDFGPARIADDYIRVLLPGAAPAAAER
jgi:glycosyltransferase involved in cell wall biosynthesis